MNPPIDVDRDALVKAAQEARKKAYAPYSNYTVGAALVTAEGEVFTGCNIENALYTAAVCAERTAIFKTMSEGNRSFVAIAVSTRNGGMPCGLCRQVMNEFAPTALIYTVDDDGNVSESTVDALLPHAFGPSDLED